jgi:hypothetical protein
MWKCQKEMVSWFNLFVLVELAWKNGHLEEALIFLGLLFEEGFPPGSIE